MNTDYSTLFWLFVLSGTVVLLAIFLISRFILTMLRNPNYADLLKNRSDDRRTKGLVALLAFVLPAGLMAQAEAAVEATEAASLWANVGLTHVIVAFAVNVVLVGVLIFTYRMLNQMKSLISPVLSPEEQEEKEEFEVSVTEKLNKILTDAVDIEEEHTILMDHEYDGIQELDNNLPPWWKYGFYLTIFVGILYLLNYHVFGFSDLQIEAYNNEVAQAEEEVAAYLAASALNVDESSVLTLMDLTSLNAGKKIFVKNCAVCHLEDGGGQTGPNLTDDHWIYGPDVKSIFKTIKYGAKNGMTSWQKKLTPIEIQQVSSYIRTLHGTSPAVAKAAQGEVMKWMPDEGVETPEEILDENTPAEEVTENPGADSENEAPEGENTDSEEEAATADL